VIVIGAGVMELVLLWRMQRHSNPLPLAGEEGEHSEAR